MTLDEAPGAATVTAVQATGPAARRLAELGVRVGSHVRVLYRTTGGGRVLALDGSRVAIDARTAAGITVTPA
ncbi:MAG: FeoA family protein [Candidatus Nanopelagicales bacterium]